MAAAVGGAELSVDPRRECSYIAATVGVVRTATLRELNSNSSALARAAEAGETIVVTDRGRPIADIVPHRPSLPPGVSRADSDAMFRKLQAAEAGFDYEAFRAQMDEAVDPYAYDAFERFG